MSEAKNNFHWGMYQSMYVDISKCRNLLFLVNISIDII